MQKTRSRRVRLASLFIALATTLGVSGITATAASALPPPPPENYYFTYCATTTSQINNNNSYNNFFNAYGWYTYDNAPVGAYGAPNYTQAVNVGDDKSGTQVVYVDWKCPSCRKITKKPLNVSTRGKKYNREAEASLRCPPARRW